MAVGSSDDEFDVSFDLTDETFLRELNEVEQAVTSAPSQQPKPLSLSKPPLKPHQQILRPPAPPAAKRARVSAGNAPSQSQQSTSTSTKTAFVHPNPFIKHEHVQVYREEDEDDTPLIIAKEGGYQVGGALSRSQSTTTSRQPTPSFQPPKLATRPQPLPPARAPVRQTSVAPPPQAATVSGLSRAEMLELQSLRAEKTRLESELRDSQSKYKEAQNVVFAKTGEITMVRKRLTRAEEEHAAQRDKELEAKRQLEDSLKSREAEYRRELERIQVDHAFRRQEIETSARRQPASQWSGSATRSGPRASSQVPPTNFYGAGRAQVASPSIGRGGRAASVVGGSPKAARTPAPAIRGFTNSFEDDSPAMELSRRARARSSDLMPPPSSMLRKGSTKSALDKRMATPSAKGKGKRRESLIKDELDEGDSLAEDFGGEDIRMDDWTAVENSMNLAEAEMDQIDEDGDTLGRDDGREIRSEIVSAVMNHTTLTHYDTHSSTLVAPSGTPRPTGSRTPSSTSSRFPTAASSSLAAFPTLGPTAAPGPTLGGASVPPSASPKVAGPVPTWRAITAVHFEQAMPIAVVNEYEKICCELYAALGRKDSHESASDALVENFCECLIALMALFEREATIGPLITALELLSSLVLVYPQFAECLLPSDPRAPPSALLVLLAKIIRRFGRPTPPPRQADTSSRGKARERSRRQRGIQARLFEPAPIGEDDRVQLEPSKRAALLFAAVDVLEGLAWRMSDSQEGAIALWLASADTVATLVDPNHPTALLTGSVRLLTLIACRGSLFRALIAVKINEGSDVRNSKVPLFDRCGTLLVRPSTAGQGALDQSIISLVTILTTKHEDSIMFIAQSSSFIPELLEKIFKDVRTLWDSDGLSASDQTLAALSAVVGRLSATVHLFYYLTCSPISTLKYAEFFAASSYAGLHDRFNVAFGTLAFAGLPDWAEGREDGAKLTALEYLAQEIMEDVSPEEAEQIEACFGNPAEEEDEAMEEGEEEEEVLVLEDEEDEEVLRAAEANLSQGSRR